MQDNLLIWQQPEVVHWSQILVNSYQQLLGEKLLGRVNSPEELSKALFYAPFVVISHGTQTDPIFNYGNRTALQLWSIGWNELIKTPSRLSAETVNRTTRSIALKEVAVKGYIENYEGIRISTTGKRFLIKGVTIWNLANEEGAQCGQAATFSDWKWL